MDAEGLAVAYAECGRIVGEGDPDRAVSVGFAAPDRQRHLHALYAFHLETMRVRDLVSQPLPGEIRLQWWRDRIADEGDIAEAAQGSPVATALIDTIRTFELPADAFERYLEARIFDLYNDPMPSRGDFEAYAGETASALVVFAAMVLDRAAAPRVAELAGHAGVAQEAVQVLGRARRDAARNAIYLPADMLEATGVSQADWLAGGEGVDRAEAAMRAFAGEHFAPLKARWTSIPRALRPAFLPALLAERNLGRDDGAKPLARLWFYWRAMRR